MYLLFFHTIHPDYCFSFLNFFELPASISPLPQVHHPSLIFTLKRPGTPRTLTEHSTTSYNKDQHKPSYQDWETQPSREKRVHKANKRIRESLTPTVNSSPLPKIKSTTITCMYRA